MRFSQTLKKTPDSFCSDFWSLFNKLRLLTPWWLSNLTCTIQVSMCIKKGQLTYVLFTLHTVTGAQQMVALSFIRGLEVNPLASRVINRKLLEGVLRLKAQSKQSYDSVAVVLCHITQKSRITLEFLLLLFFFFFFTSPWK